jgi:uncharacterized RDD family membrane protein YckC
VITEFEKDRMEEPHNPYSAPSAPLAVAAVTGDPVLADRGTRLLAAIIDTIIMLCVLTPVMFAGGYFTLIMSGQKPGFVMQSLWGVVGFVIFCVIQGYPLAMNGQTWGKKALKIKIVDLDGHKADVVRLLGLRYGMTQLITLVPIVGSIYNLVNVLMIFGEDRRCLHDKIAGTRVVVAQ